MNQHDDILSELTQLSPTLSKISRQNLFKVPDGYFEMLSSQLLLLVRSAHSQSITSKMEASVPAGYFETLADNIMARIKRESFSDTEVETNAISKVVADIGSKNVYTVPEGYFETLNAQTLNAFLLLSPADVKVETRSLSTLVAEIGNQNVYKVPDGYFDQLEEKLAVLTQVPARVVNMKRRFTAFRYAAAAVVTALVGLSVFFILNKDNAIQRTGQTVAVLSDAKQILQTNSFDKEFSSVSDAAIVSYLEGKGQDVEAALVASLSDDKDLPDVDEYIINENTLNEVLKTLDLNN